MNREELIKMFDEADLTYSYMGLNPGGGEEEIFELDEEKIKDFIFDIIIPEVLKDFIPNNRDWQYSRFSNIKNNSTHLKEYEILFKDKAKELYNINL